MDRTHKIAGAMLGCGCNAGVVVPFLDFWCYLDRFLASSFYHYNVKNVKARGVDIRVKSKGMCGKRKEN